MTRDPIKPRRESRTCDMVFKDDRVELRFSATYSWDAHARVREVFCQPFKVGAGLQDLIKQSCIVLSHCLQRGATMDEIARSLGEDETAKPPRSILGLIVRGGVQLDRRIAEGGG